jgi:branched-chain amino acid transport system ATP-binding protein
MSTLLEVKGVTKRFGGLTAVNNVSFNVNKGDILSVIGPNGAGKSTLFKLISSFLTTSDGEVLLSGKRINNLAPHGGPLGGGAYLPRDDHFQVHDSA